MEVQGQTDTRRHPRFKLDANLKIRSRSAGVLSGYAIDLSESGMAAMLVVEVSIGEIVDLEFQLPFGPISVRAVVRERNAFRYGFQFVQPNPAHRQIVQACTTLPPND
jgi:hypothetical protein